MIYSLRKLFLSANERSIIQLQGERRVKNLINIEIFGQGKTLQMNLPGYLFKIGTIMPQKKKHRVRKNEIESPNHIH